MITEVVNTERNPEAGTQKGARIIRAGGLVAFPTETVYFLIMDEALLKNVT